MHSENSKRFLAKHKNIYSANTIEFPVFLLAQEPLTLHGIVFVAGKPIDDLNVDSELLGIRRLKSKQHLAKLDKICYNLSDLLKRLKGQETWFIDCKGNTFKYIKTQSAKVTSHRVRKIELRETYSILHLEGIDYPFLIDRPIPFTSFARVVYFKSVPWFIFSVENRHKKPSIIKV